MKRKFILFLILAILILIIPKSYRLLVVKVSGYPVLAKEDKDRIARIENLNEVDLNDYDSYISEDENFRLTLYIQKETPEEYRHISIFSTLEYIGENMTIEIWSGRPYYSYSISQNSEYYIMYDILPEYGPIVLKKNERYIIPLEKNIGYSQNDPDILYWKAFADDEYIRLPIGEYELKFSVEFDIGEDGKHYKNEIAKMIKVIE